MRDAMNIVTMSHARVFSWGANSYGQLGAGHRIDSLLPVQCLVSDEVAQTVVYLAGGGGHTVLLTKAGELYSCGWNKHGQLGHSQVSESVALPRRISDLPKITKVSCGWNHTLAISVTGELFGWGSNSFGQLGQHEREASRPDPLQLSRELFRGSSVTEVAAGLRHSVALVETGEVFTWGAGRRGQLGHGEEGLTGCPQPSKVMALKGTTCRGVAAGAYHTAAVTDSGRVFCWGCNKHDQCAVAVSTVAEEEVEQGPAAAAGKIQGEGGDMLRVVLEPCEVQLLPTVTMVYCGWSHTLAVTEDKRLFGWGRSDYGQLGTATLDGGVEQSRKCNPVPTEIERLKGVQQVSCGSEHCIAIDSEPAITLCALPAGTPLLFPPIGKGGVVTWGWNEHGMCATGDETNVFSPHTVEGLASERGVPHLVGAGAGHSLVLLREPPTNPDPNVSSSLQE